MSPLPQRMTDHWWWRPGVRPFRRLYVWHILFTEQPEVAELVRRCQARLAGISGLDLVPPPWLHMTTQVVGFADEIEEDEVTAMIGAVSERFQRLEPAPVVLGESLVLDEGVVLGIRPERALDPARDGIRDAVASSVRRHQLADEPHWTPHVTVAYSNTDAPAEPIIAAMRPAPTGIDLQVREVTLVSQERIDHSYRWRRVAAVPLGVR